MNAHNDAKEAVSMDDWLPGWWYGLLIFGWVVVWFYIGGKLHFAVVLLLMILHYFLCSIPVAVKWNLQRTVYGVLYYTQHGPSKRLYSTELKLLHDGSVPDGADPVTMARGERMHPMLRVEGQDVMRNILNVTNVAACTMFFESDIGKYMVLVHMAKLPSKGDWNLVESAIRDASWCFRGFWPRFVEPKCMSDAEPQPAFLLSLAFSAHNHGGGSNARR